MTGSPPGSGSSGGASGPSFGLPAALAPWAAHLAVLAPDLALSLAPWLGRLALAIGPLSAAARARTGEPDGYHGVSRRGSYERMITTEWGMAEVYPEEFLRRAAMGEHLFLELARREPRGALRSIAIVSAGPAQLGAPRLVHLAALIVLARRAAAAGAGLSWGVLEDGDRRLLDALDPPAIRRLLDARTAAAAEPDAIVGWLDALDALGDDAAREVWFIGDAEHAGFARRRGAACLVVDDLLEPERRVIDVQVQRRGPAIRLRLELPAPELCARLLREPFERSGGTTAVHDGGAARDARFAPDGRRLLVQLASGAILTWPIPNSPRGKPGSLRRWTPRPVHRVIAIGAAQRTSLVATANRDDPSEVELHGGGQPPARVLLPGNVAAALWTHLARPAPAIGTCALVKLRSGAGPDLVLLIAGHLLVLPAFSWPAPGTALPALPFDPVAPDTARKILATAFFTRAAVWAERRHGGPIRIVRATGSGNQTVGHVGEPNRDHAYLGFASPDGPSGWGTIGVAIDDERWAVGAERLAPTTLHTADPVLGVCSLGEVPGLLTRPHAYRLVWQWPDRREMLPTSTAPILAATVCAQRPQIAWVTEAGVVVYSMQYRAILARLHAGSS